MKLTDVRAKAFAMPLNNPAYPKGPYKFYNREFVVITYRTDIAVARLWASVRARRVADGKRQAAEARRR
jgi:acetoacetate decarboxylase